MDPCRLGKNSEEDLQEALRDLHVDDDARHHNIDFKLLNHWSAESQLCISWASVETAPPLLNHWCPWPRLACYRQQ